MLFATGLSLQHVIITEELLHDYKKKRQITTNVPHIWIKADEDGLQQDLWDSYNTNQCQCNMQHTTVSKKPLQAFQIKFLVTSMLKHGKRLLFKLKVTLLWKANKMLSKGPDFSFNHVFAAVKNSFQSVLQYKHYFIFLKRSTVKTLQRLASYPNTPPINSRFLHQISKVR